MIPPTITTPNGIRLVDAAPKDNASGNAPNAMARLVMTGRIFRLYGPPPKVQLSDDVLRQNEEATTRKNSFNHQIFLRNFIQKYQHYWIFFLYPMFLLNWLLIRDFKDFYSSKRYIKKIINIPVKEYYTLWFFKFFFITYTLLIPIFIFDIEVSQALIGFLIQMICGSLLGMVILLTPHVNTQNSFPIPNEKEELTSTWLRHQFITTNDINGDNFFSKYNLSEENKIVSLILGGPNRYYDFNEIDLGNIFLSIKDIFLDKGFKLILIRSRRTPENIIDFAKKFFLNSAVIIDFVSKEFYLSALKISKTIIVTCDSTSMISECAITQKPIFVAKMKAKRRNKRFEYFLNSFKEKGIIRFLGESTDYWKYPALDETNRIATIIKERLN